jgi:hypothetical protein
MGIILYQLKFDPDPGQAIVPDFFEFSLKISFINGKNTKAKKKSLF